MREEPEGMLGRVLSALIQVAHPSWWLVVVVLVVAVVWCGVRFADRWALAVERLMLACDRKAARKAALAATTSEAGQHALAVLAELNVQTAALSASPRSSRRRKRSADDRTPEKAKAADA
jgi:hypothetical protein